MFPEPKTADVIRIFIGFDSGEPVAYHVLSHSLLARATQPTSITPIVLDSLNGIFTRERNSLQSTEFSFSRFLVPWLSGYSGWSIFMDCDMLCITDIANLWALRNENYDVMCVQHEHIPQEKTKFRGATQTAYEKKNWSSMVLFNNARCTALTPDYVNTASGLELHRFKWLSDDNRIGALPQGWNHLADYSDTALKDTHLIHYTEGGPYFEEYRTCEHAGLWFAEKNAMDQPLSKRQL
ncbi:glycosyltransferase [Paracoccus liaowanqingii]|uniref:Glycosyltransferase n=1 Tax=Paracoccus liaowanqingii TaxID=2560053 RepID=A0A4Z1CF13_9RHOB|nr:glycosyltransferase [Paracoccus liaowanqingii]